MTFQTGYVPSSHDPNDWDFSASAVYGASSRTPKSIRVSPHQHRDQVGQSCVGQSVIVGGVQDLNAKQVELGVAAPHAILRADGSLERDSEGRLVVEYRVPTLLPDLSTLFQWGGARRLAYRLAGAAIPDSGIPDVGSSYRLNIMWLRDVANGGGAREDRLWPETPRNIPRVPPTHVDQADPLVTVESYYRIRYEDSGADTLRDACIAALEGFDRGECSKPLGSMELPEAFANTPDGGVCDDANPGKDIGEHAMPVGGYDDPNDALVFENSWSRPQTVLVRIPYLAQRGRGGEFWVLKGLVYIPRRAA